MNKIALAIKEATPDNYDEIWNIFQQVIIPGDTYVYDETTTKSEFIDIWCNKQVKTYIAQMDNDIVGTYILKANFPGRGSHIANCSYMVSEKARGMGVGQYMAEHSVQLAKELGFIGIQFNLVVSSNKNAIKLWQKSGFKIIGTTPKGFKHKELGLIDSYIMYRSVQKTEEAILTINEGGNLLDWAPVAAPSKPVIKGTHCMLELLDINKHADKLYELLPPTNETDHWANLPYGPFYSFINFKDWLNMVLKDQTSLMYAILDIKSQQPIGYAGYLRINPEHGVIEVGGLFFSELLKKTTAATESMYLMMQYVFKELGYRRYEWKCNTLNQASRNAALRLGFKFEGIFRQSNVYKQCNRDTAWFSIIDTEWPDIKIKFEKWLSTSNFDSNGNQILSLRDIIV